MTRALGAWVVVALLASSGVANAQGASDSKPADKKPADKKPGGSDTPPPPPASSAKRQPPPGPPRADAQQPHPYLVEPAPEQPTRKLEIGPDFGVAARPAQGNATSYGAGFAWGAHFLITAQPWLGLRLSFMNTRHPVDVPRGALGLADTAVDQPDLDVTLLAARLEPTWVVGPRFRAFAGIGAGWARISAGRASSSGALSIRTAERTGVALEFSGALGARVDIVPDWLVGTLALSGAFVTNQSGDVFSTTQAFDQAGAPISLGGLPRFATSLSALAGLGLAL